jgi:hypothetical protein
MDTDADGPIAPDWANYTYLCSIFTGPDHVLQAINAKRQMMVTPGMKDWYVIHSESESDLYYGYYKSWDDPTQEKEYARAQGDHTKLMSLSDGAGQRIFQQVLPQPLSLPDPPAPAEWDVFRDPGYWTLLICKYKDDPRRKQYAVDAVKTLREHGYAAYYHHFLGVSEVYVGEFPMQSVKSQQSDVAKSTKGSELLVLSQEIPGLDKNPPLGKDGKPMTVIMPKLEIVDPKLKALIVDFPYTLMNGIPTATPMSMPDHSIQAVPFPSYLTQVPHTGNSDKVDLQGPYSGPDNAAQGTASQDIPTQSPPTPSDGSPDGTAQPAKPAPKVPTGLGGM